MLLRRRKEKEEDVGIVAGRDICQRSAPPQKGKEKGRRETGRAEERVGVGSRHIKERLE